MRIELQKTLVIFLFAFFLTPGIVFAHQPRITESLTTEVPDPEVSKAYYGKLAGESNVYIIRANEPFDLYINVLVPDIAGQKKDVSAMLLKDGMQIVFLDGANFPWKQFYEPFGVDTYWMGPEYKARADAGIYEIRVSSSKNDSKYSLAIGEIEAFDGKEIINALTLIPELKKNFFNESPISFIVSPFGWGMIVAIYLLAGIVGLVYRFIARRFARSASGKVSKNIGTRDRIIRFILGVILLLGAISTTWSPVVIFVSGFLVFEAVFSWCAAYQLVGKNTCPIV